MRQRNPDCSHGGRGGPRGVPPSGRFTLAAVFLGLAVAQASADSGVPYVVLHGRAFVESAAEARALAPESGRLPRGAGLRTEAASAAVFFFDSGARLSLMSEGVIRYDGESRRAAGLDQMLFFAEGSLVGSVSADGAGERVRVISALGELRVRGADFVTSSFVDGEGMSNQLIGVTSGSVEFFPVGEGAVSRGVFAGDSISVRQTDAEADAAPRVNERHLSEDMRYRLQTGLAQIEDAAVRRDRLNERVRQTRAPSLIPPPDQLPAVSPGAGLPAPRTQE